MPRSLMKFNQQGKTRLWAMGNGATDTVYFCNDGSIVLNGVAYGKVADVSLNGHSLVEGGEAILPTSIKNPYKLVIGSQEYDGSELITISKSTLDTLLAKGSANGVVPLDSRTKIDPTYLYSYVDDIVDIIGCYEYNGGLYRPLVDGKLKKNPAVTDFEESCRISPTASPGTLYMALDYIAQSNYPGIYQSNEISWVRDYGETSKIYVEVSTNKQYRFAENDYTPHEVVASPGTTDDIVEGTKKFVTQAQKDDWDAHIGNTTYHVTSGDKTRWDSKYSKPNSGIPEIDLDSDLQNKISQGEDAYAAAVQGIRKAATGIRAIAQASDSAIVSEKNLATVLKVITDRLDALEAALTLEIPD